MSPEEESSLEREADGPQNAAAGEAEARDAEPGGPRADRDADPDGRALPRREPAARRGHSAVSSPRLSVEQLAQLRERLAGLKAESQPPEE